MVEISWFDSPIKLEVGNRLGLIVGETKDGKFYAIDFGEGEIKFMAADAPARLNFLAVN